MRKNIQTYPRTPLIHRPDPYVVIATNQSPAEVITDSQALLATSHVDLDMWLLVYAGNCVCCCRPMVQGRAGRLRSKQYEITQGRAAGQGS